MWYMHAFQGKKKILSFINTQLKLLLVQSSALYSGNYILLVKEGCIHLLRQSNFCQEKSTTF